MSTGITFTRRKALDLAEAAAGKKIFGTVHAGTINDKQFSHLFESISGIRESEMLAVTNELRRTTIEAFGLGMTVCIPGFGVLRLIGGGTEDPTAADGGTPLSLTVNLLVDRSLQAAIAVPGMVEKTVVNQVERKPEINTVKDLATQASDSTMTPGALLTIRGKNLKFNNTKSEQGIYFVPASGTGEVIKCGVTTEPRTVQVDALIPAGLTVGDSYYVEIRAVLSGSRKLKTGRFEQVLTVA